MNNSFTTKIARAGVIASLYAVLTIALAPISYGAVQFRISEALTILPLIFPEATIGLVIGCFIANIFGNGILDLIFGTIATLISSLLTMLIGRIIKNTPTKLILGGLMPIIFNAIIVPFTFLAVTELKEAYLISALTVALGEAVTVYCLGIPLYFPINEYYIKRYASENKKKDN